MWEAFAVQKSFSYLFNKNFSVFGYKVKHLTSWPLNELVKLTMLWTTGPRSFNIDIHIGLMAFKYFDYPLPDFLISLLVGMELRFTKRVEQPKTHSTKILLFILLLLIDTNSSMWGKVTKISFFSWNGQYLCVAIRIYLLSVTNFRVTKSASVKK